MKQFLCIPLFLLYVASAFAQQNEEATTADHQMEIGLNITNTLAGFFNSGGQGTLLDPYLFSFKLIKGQRIYRSGFDFRVSSRSEFENTGTRDTKASSADVRIGLEWRKSTSDRFTIYWGADIIGGYESEKVDFFTFNGTTLKLDEYIGSIGGGPVMGIIFSLNESMFLSTEAAIYGRYERGRVDNELVPGMPTGNQSIEGFSIVPMIPNSLYLNIRF